MASGNESAAVAEGRYAAEGASDLGTERREKDAETAPLTGAQIGDTLLVDLRHGGHMTDHTHGAEDAPVEEGVFRSFVKTDIPIGSADGADKFLVHHLMFRPGNRGTVGMGEDAQLSDPLGDKTSFSS